jgi:UDP-N-acetyl-D-mannosaminuronic acid dehydrogenase
MPIRSDKKKNVAVVGIGRVGLPLALTIASKNYFVFGIDKDSEKTSEINKGIMPFMEKGANVLLKKNIDKNFTATTDYSVVENCGTIIITLGTPIDENMNPMFTQIESALEKMTPYLVSGQLLILRSTVSPGTTEYVASIIEETTQLRVGKNFYLAFCPERISEGNSIDEIPKITQIVGGLDKKSTSQAVELFHSIGVKTLETDAVSSELAKLFTNMYRYINFAISNEFMVLAEKYKRDIYEIINLVNYGYPRGGLKSPGLTGGPCLFKDGFFLISDLPFGDLISASWKINESIPVILINRVAEEMDLKGKNATILGLAFKADIDDTRESLSFKVRKSLYRERAKVTLQDPYIKEYKYQDVEQDVYKSVKNADLIFVATNHKEYYKLDIEKLKLLANEDCMVCDIWNVFEMDKITFRLKDLSV